MSKIVEHLKTCLDCKPGKRAVIIDPGVDPRLVPNYTNQTRLCEEATRIKEEEEKR